MGVYHGLTARCNATCVSVVPHELPLLYEVSVNLSLSLLMECFEMCMMIRAACVYF